MKLSYSFAEAFALVALGEVDLIEEIIIGEDRMIRFSGVKAGEACT